jgi:hypothetical protein
MTRTSTRTRTGLRSRRTPSTPAQRELPPSTNARARWDAFRYRGYSTVTAAALPIAEELHKQGKSWEKIAQQLMVSKTSLYNWRRLQRLSLRIGDLEMTTPSGISRVPGHRDHHA